MHACGHDGHTAMLLGAAAYLAASRRFSGTVYCIFQPAEENEGGGRVMVEQGLFERFPAESVFGMHNWPGMPAGMFAVRAGPMMAGSDCFEIVVRGRGGHGAMPHLADDVIVAAAAIVGALQTVVSRTIEPIEPAVISVTQVHAGETWNVIPETAVLRGTVRSFSAAVQDRIEGALTRIADAIAAAHGCHAEVRYQRQYPATINSPAETEHAATAAARVVGSERVVRNPPPTMGSEDFAFMLQARPGCYIWLGSGRDDASPMLHTPGYDFNDDILVIGASYWATLVETMLG
jgi:hippurate hydrolase